MKLLTPAKSSFFFVLFFISIFSVFSQEEDAEAQKSSATIEVALSSDDETSANSDAITFSENPPAEKQTFTDFLFEIFNFSQTGKTVLEEVPQYEDISGTACSLLMHSLWKDFKPQFLYQFLNPDFAFHEGEKIEPVLVDELSEIDSLSLLEILDGRDEPALLEEAETPVLNRIKDGSLRKFSCNGEKFSINVSGGFTSLTNVSEKLVVRRIYDESFKLIKKENYRNSTELTSITQLSQTDYEYSPENGNLLKTVLENFPQKTKLERDFSENGRLSSEQKFHYEEIKTVYTAAADYTKTFYFDNGFSVVSEFENGLKISESTWENENLLRRRTFEAD